MDRDGAIKLIEAASHNGIRRYVMISAMHAEEPRGDEVFQTYLRAKVEADEALRRSGLDYTIVRPGRLTNDPGGGHVRLGTRLARAEIPRADVAAVREFRRGLRPGDSSDRRLPVQRDVWRAADCRSGRLSHRWPRWHRFVMNPKSAHIRPVIYPLQASMAQ